MTGAALFYYLNLQAPSPHNILALTDKYSAKNVRIVLSALRPTSK